MNAVQKAEKDGLRLSIFQDEMPESPREWDNLGTMACWHSRYDLGDGGEYDRPASDFRPEVHAVCLPLYLYDHSGLRMKVGSFQGLLPQGHTEFDSGQVGWIYADREKILKEYGVKKLSKSVLAKVEVCLRSEVKTYDQYLSGDVYGFVCEKLQPDEVCEKCKHNSGGDWEHEDSCWGFYGHDWKENGIAEHVPEEYRPLINLLE